MAKHVKLFLMQIDEDPLFHIDEVNPTLYKVINEINKAKVIYVIDQARAPVRGYCIV